MVSTSRTEEQVGYTEFSCRIYTMKLTVLNSQLRELIIVDLKECLLSFRHRVNLIESQILIVELENHSVS